MNDHLLISILLRCESFNFLGVDLKIPSLEERTKAYSLTFKCIKKIIDPKEIGQNVFYR